MNIPIAPSAPTLVGHPYGTSGRSEDVREVYRALLKVGRQSSIYDVYRYERPVPALQEEFGQAVSEKLLAGVRIFLLNGDEVEPACHTIDIRDPDSFAKGYNIVFPTWELPTYPSGWARELERFAEIWTPSEFIYDSVSRAVDVPIYHMPWACEPRVARDLGRRYFRIPENRFAVLFFWDATSYAARKNPGAVIDVFRGVVQRRPLAPVQLVLKVNNPGRDAEALRHLKEELENMRDRVTLIERPMTNDEIKNLIRISDCFISLHRSEGFGRGLAEAMYFGVPVIGTAWSGNMDFMTPETSFLVDYDLVPVREGEYPYWAGQHWAEAKRAQAMTHLLALIDNPRMGASIGRAAGIRLRKHFSHRAQGVRYLTRIEEIERSLGLSSLAPERQAAASKSDGSGAVGRAPWRQLPA
jgi:glycosyltransferase involved in cell wall biosynthesis